MLFSQTSTQRNPVLTDISTSEPYHEDGGRTVSALRESSRRTPQPEPRAAPKDAEASPPAALSRSRAGLPEPAQRAEAAGEAPGQSAPSTAPGPGPQPPHRPDRAVPHRGLRAGPAAPPPPNSRIPQRYLLGAGLLRGGRGRGGHFAIRSGRGGRGSLLHFVRGGGGGGGSRRGGGSGPSAPKHGAAPPRSALARLRRDRPGRGVSAGRVGSRSGGSALGNRLYIFSRARLPRAALLAEPLLRALLPSLPERPEPDGGPVLKHEAPSSPLPAG